MDLRALLKKTVSRTPEDADVRELVLLCRTIALVFLRKKARSGRLFRDYSSLHLEDLAWDCVADLFNRDEQGTLLQIKAYFDGIDLNGSSEELLLTHLRRLVFSRVNQSIFRNYGEADPALSKIIRNMKLAIQSLRNFVPVDRYGEQCISPSLCDPAHHLPGMDREEMERQFRPVLSPNDTIPEMLAKVSKGLREQSDFSRTVSLVALAQLFRSVYETSQSEPEQADGAEHRLAVEDCRRIIDAACDRISAHYRGKYVGAKGVPAQMFDGYFTAIRRSLSRRLIDRDGEEFSLYEAMREQFPSLTEESYAKDHKAKLEYLLRLAFKDVVSVYQRGE